MSFAPFMLRAFLVAAVGLVLTASTLSTPAAGTSIEPYASYDPQTACVTQTQPGTAYLIDWLMKQYPGTGNASTLRTCGSNTSEHYDGRALDWAVDYASTTQRATAYRLLDRLFATDSAGNPHALARRMGIMYLIWDDHIYSAYGSPHFSKRLYTRCDPFGACSKTTRHRDHVHFSLSRAGAAAQTSFYQAAGVTPAPVLEPGTVQLDSDDTAVVKVPVPADGKSVTTSFKLTAGETYRIVGAGLYRYGPGSRIGDAACRWGRSSWVPTAAGLLVNGTSPWTGACDGNHTHVASYKAPSTARLTLRLADSTPGNNRGSLSFYILRSDVPVGTVAARFAAASAEPRPVTGAGTSAPRLGRETVMVPAAAARGRSTQRSLRTGARYRVRVTGLARSGSDRFDGSCVRYAGRWRPQHTLDLTRPPADHLSLYIQGVPVRLRAAGSTSACSGSAHRYVGTFRAIARGKARIKVWDPFGYGNNSGALRVALRRLA